MKSGLQSPKATKHKDNGTVAASEKPTHFFQKQLGGEEALSWTTAELLVLWQAKS
jgi:hypothetical protein